MTMKFETVVMDNLCETWVPGKPVIFEQAKSIVGCFGTTTARDFDEIGDWVNACESIEDEFKLSNFY